MNHLKNHIYFLYNNSYELKITGEWMFRATCNTRDFKKVINATSNLVDEICFEVDENGIKASAMDPSHVALVSMEMPKDVFEEYEGDIQDIGIDLEALKKIIARGRGDEKLILDLDVEKNKLNITFKSNVTRKFSIALYDVSSSNLKVPDIEYPNSVSIKAGAFVEALKDAELVNDHITLKIDENKFVIYSKGDLNQSETVFDNSIDDDESALADFNMGEASRSTFNLAYLKDLTKSTAAEDLLKIYLGSDMPVKIEYEVSGSKLVFLLAPRIES